jgi:hypothetical protein
VKVTAELLGRNNESELIAVLAGPFHDYCVMRIAVDAGGRWPTSLLKAVLVGAA